MSTNYLQRSTSPWPIVLALAITSGAYGQQTIYSNAKTTDPTATGLATGNRSSSGHTTSSPDLWSELQSETGANAIAGFSSYLTGASGAYRFADDFTVAGSSGWRIDSIRLFAYQVGASPGLPPFSGVNLRIWSGPPGEPGSEVVFGDTTTNRLARVQSTGVYRIFASVTPPFPLVPDYERLIWQNELDVGGLILPPGTYWLDWQYMSFASGVEAFSPALTVPGKRTLPGWNARQQSPDGVWSAVLDMGKPASAADVPQDFPFLIQGSGNCLGDFSGDGMIDFSDYLTFLNLFDAGDPLADLTADGRVDFSDFLAFLNLFETPCER